MAGCAEPRPASGDAHHAKPVLVGAAAHQTAHNAAPAGCEVPEIATITSHSLTDVGAILDAHYLSRNTQLAESAIKKLERYDRETKTPN
jgi:hypothetical protein